MRLMIPKLRQETTVRLIMTDRQFLITAQHDAIANDAFATCPADIDMLPVLKGEQLVGVLRRDAKRAKETPVQDAMDSLHAYARNVNTPVEDVLYELAQGHPLVITRGRRFVGVLTYADLNRRAFRVLLYALLAELEGRLADAVREKYPNPDALIAKHGEAISKDALERWKASETEDVAIHPVEGMDLSDLAKIFAADETLRPILRVSTKKAAKDALGGLVELRHLVMHPVRLVVKTPKDVEQLERRLERLQVLLEASDPN